MTLLFSSLCCWLTYAVTSHLLLVVQHSFYSFYSICIGYCSSGNAEHRIGKTSYCFGSAASSNPTFFLLTFCLSIYVFCCLIFWSRYHSMSRFFFFITIAYSIIIFYIWCCPLVVMMLHASPITVYDVIIRHFLPLANERDFLFKLFCCKLLNCC